MTKREGSQEDQVRSTIQSFDVAVQTGDLTTLRSITCGSHPRRLRGLRRARVGATPTARLGGQTVSGDRQHRPGRRQRQHAEANITTFMAYDPQLRSTRSLDLQFRDDQWKICQSNSSG